MSYLAGFSGQEWNGNILVLYTQHKIMVIYNADKEFHNIIQFRCNNIDEWAWLMNIFHMVNWQNVYF